MPVEFVQSATELREGTPIEPRVFLSQTATEITASSYVFKTITSESKKTSPINEEIELLSNSNLTPQDFVFNFDSSSEYFKISSSNGRLL